jgi:hypothetical protein
LSLFWYATGQRAVQVLSIQALVWRSTEFIWQSSIWYNISHESETKEIWKLSPSRTQKSVFAPDGNLEVVHSISFKTEDNREEVWKKQHYIAQVLFLDWRNYCPFKSSRQIQTLVPARSIKSTSAEVRSVVWRPGFPERETFTTSLEVYVWKHRHILQTTR